VHEIANALRALDLQVDAVPADRKLPARLEEGRYGFAFNIAEGPLTLTGKARRCREAIPAAVCELFGLPYTGSDPLTLALTLDKSLARRIVSPEVPVVRAMLLTDDSTTGHIADLRFPVIVKPNDEGSSKGIHADCLAGDPSAAMARARWLQQNYHCHVLVEEFLPGVEVTVGLAGNTPNERILGMMEIAPADDCDPFVYSLEVKRNWRQRVVYHVPPRLDVRTLDRLRDSALQAYRLLGCRDVARMDFRMNAQGQPCFMECNALPGLSRTNSDIVMLSRKVIPYEMLVQGILLDAAARTGVDLL
jgi:D-alanine-D-alanine ligase